MPPVPRRKAGSKPVTSDASDTTAPRRAPGTASEGPPPSPGGPPPKAPPGGWDPRKPPRAASGPRPALQKSLEELFSAPAYFYALTGDEWAETHINTTAPRMAEAWYKLAQKNPAVKRTLESLTTGSAWGGVAIATGATLLPLLAHHELLPAPAQALFAGVPTTGTPRGPIVPPPPPPPPPAMPMAAPGVPPAPAGGGGTSTPIVPPPGGMTPPTAPGAPPGVVTVAGSNNRAVMVEA